MNKIPDNVMKLLRKKGVSDESVVTVKDGAVYYGDSLVAVLVEDKGYLIDEQPDHRYDGADLSDYNDIIVAAKLSKEKSPATCKAVSVIHDKVVMALLATNFLIENSNRESLSDNRRRIINAKFVACKIWREGKLKKESA